MKDSKVKSAPRFKSVVNGYDKKSVEKFITDEQSKSAQAETALKDAARALKAECENLTAEVELLRSREEQIKNTLVAATEKSKKMELDVKLRYATELERLKLFRSKWKNAYDEIKERYHFSKDSLNMESVAVNTEMEIQRVLMQDFSIPRGDACDEQDKAFAEEAERLTPTESNIRELRQKLVEASERKTAVTEATKNAAFSLEDALNPKESLMDLCKELL